jgi:hypothetical protein
MHLLQCHAGLEGWHRITLPTTISRTNARLQVRMHHCQPQPVTAFSAETRKQTVICNEFRQETKQGTRAIPTSYTRQSPRNYYNVPREPTLQEVTSSIAPSAMCSKGKKDRKNIRNGIGNQNVRANSHEEVRSTRVTKQYTNMPHSTTDHMPCTEFAVRRATYQQRCFPECFCNGNQTLTLTRNKRVQRTPYLLF